MSEAHTCPQCNFGTIIRHREIQSGDISSCPHCGATNVFLEAINGGVLTPPTWQLFPYDTPRQALIKKLRERDRLEAEAQRRKAWNRMVPHPLPADRKHPKDSTPPWRR